MINLTIEINRYIEEMFWWLLVTEDNQVLVKKFFDIYEEPKLDFPF